MSLLRVCDIAAFAPIFEQLNIKIETETLSEYDFMFWAKIWRRKTSASFALNLPADSRTKQLQEAVNAMPSSDPDLTDDEFVALLSLLFQQRALYPNTWTSFCEDMKHSICTFYTGVAYLRIWADKIMPTCPPNAALNRLFAGIAPHPLLVELFSKCAGHKASAVYTWPSVIEFNKAFRDLFLEWRESSILDKYVCLEPDNSLCMIPFPVGWNPSYTTMLTKLKINNV